MATNSVSGRCTTCTCIFDRLHMRVRGASEGRLSGQLSRLVRVYLVSTSWYKRYRGYIKPLRPGQTRVPRADIHVVHAVTESSITPL